jgi:hypothetical protein
MIAPRTVGVPEPPEPGSPAPPAPPAPVTDRTPPTPWVLRMDRTRGMMPPTPAPDALPRGWIGIGLNCSDCGAEDAGNGMMAWSFGSLPTVSYVDPEGPAASAGLHRGDQITHLDGISLLTEEGGRRFGAVRPGQTIRYTVVRDGSTRNFKVTAGTRPGERIMALDAMRDQLRALRDARDMNQAERESQRRSLEKAMQAMERSRIISARAGPHSRRLRYAGTVAGSDVEVRGLGNVVVDDSGDEIVITTPEATIRIHPSAGKDAKQK